VAREVIRKVFAGRSLQQLAASFFTHILTGERCSPFSTEAGEDDPIGQFRPLFSGWFF
jgi:hypothetical protein